MAAALQGITDRTQSQDFEWAVMAIEIQREVGGNLAEVLQTVSETMMARNRLKGEIRALTAEGRISAIVLGSLPFAMGGFLWFSNREYLQPLLDRRLWEAWPSSPGSCSWPAEFLAPEDRQHRGMNITSTRRSVARRIHGSALVFFVIVWVGLGVTRAREDMTNRLGV